VENNSKFRKKFISIQGEVFWRKLGTGWRERPGALGGRGGGYLPTFIEGKVHGIWHRDSARKESEINETLSYPRKVNMCI